VSATGTGSIAGPYAVTLANAKAGEETFKIVVNKDGKFKLRLKTTDNKIDVTSHEFSVTKRIRKYAIPYPDFPNYDPNKFDEQFVDAATHWGNFYSRPVDTVDRIKAMSVAESNVGANVQNPTSRPHDILTIGHPTDAVLVKIQATQDQWDLDIVHPKNPAADARYKKLNYPTAGIATTREAIKWGVLWFYVKAFSQPPPSTIEANPNWTYDKRNQAPFTAIDGIEEPEFRFKAWHSWDVATQKYNGGGVGDYMTRVNGALLQGEVWNAPGNNKVWPILTNKAGRP
jgi:hypothetical protein